MNTGGSSSGGLSAGAIVGIVFGVIIGIILVILIVIAVIYFLKRYNHDQKNGKRFVTDITSCCLRYLHPGMILLYLAALVLHDQDVFA